MSGRRSKDRESSYRVGIQVVCPCQSDAIGLCVHTESVELRLSQCDRLYSSLPPPSLSPPPSLLYALFSRISVTLILRTKKLFETVSEAKTDDGIAHEICDRFDFFPRQRSPFFLPSLKRFSSCFYTIRARRVMPRPRLSIPVPRLSPLTGTTYTATPLRRTFATPPPNPPTPPTPPTASTSRRSIVDITLIGVGGASLTGYLLYKMNEKKGTREGSNELAGKEGERSAFTIPVLEQ
jgi:hypothetical protein